MNKDYHKTLKVEKECIKKCELLGINSGCWEDHYGQFIDYCIRNLRVIMIQNEYTWRSYKN